MQLILNGINGNYLRNIIEAALSETERVDAAVAYATESSLLFDWCSDNNLPLRFWGRFDENVPVGIPVLKKFLNQRSGNYTCKLVRQFHPKVIWWHGYGAYIGSANLTQSAWWNNVEAGVFLSEEELVKQGHDFELEGMFIEIDQHAAPLTQELFDLMSARALVLNNRRSQERERDEKILASELVPYWEGLASRNKRSATERRRQAFLNEWNSTLQITRDIAEKVSTPQNNPSWVQPAVPKGALVDQFLHAHYYKRTFKNGRANYETHYQQNKHNPDHAVQDAILWWQDLPSDTPENKTLNKIAPMLREAFSKNALITMSEDRFVKVLSHVHAAKEFARRVSNRLVGLRVGQPVEQALKIEALARQLFRARNDNEKSVLDTLSYVLYAGQKHDVPSRLWAALTDPDWKVELLGVSTLGEIVGWAMPDDFPPRNGRTSKALRSLGYDVRVHNG